MIAPSVQSLVTRLARRHRKSEATSAPAEPPPFPCPICDEHMSIRTKGSDDWLGLKDARVHGLKCQACGMIADRIFHPAIGYDGNIVV